jgi:hypothetical protein
MKKFAVIFSLLSLISCKDDDTFLTENNKGFNGEIQFAKSFGGSDQDMPKSVVATRDGGFLVIGTTKSNDGDISVKVGLLEDIWLTKYSIDGNLLWSKTYGGSLDDFGYSVLENPDGTLVIAGYSKSSDGDVPSNLGMHDYLIIKTDSNGNKIWAKSYGFMSHDHAHKIIATSDGGYLVAGYVDYAGIGSKSSAVLHGVGEYYIIKLNSAGDKVWDNYFGGTQNDRIFDVVQANDGGYVVVGYSESNDFDAEDNHGGYDYWVIKTNAIGELVWKKSYGGSGLDQAYGIKKSINNTYVITGVSSSSDGDNTSNISESDFWVISIDDNGKLLWNKSFGGPDFELANSISITQEGNFLISGHTRSTSGNITQNKGENDFWLITISPSGKLLWQKTFGGSNFDFGIDAVQLKDGSYVMIGETFSNDQDVPSNKGNNDLFIVRVK